MIKLPESLRNLFGTHGEPAARMTNAPLFVTGSMRSGTTFLVDKLSSHPQLLKIGVELNQVWTDIGGASIKGTCDHKVAADASAEYTYQMTTYFANFIQESQSFKRKAMRRYAKYFHGLGRVSYDWENIIPVNKSPHLMNKLGYVGALFPKSTLLLIVRDVYSHSASMKYHFEKLHKADGRTYFMEDSPEACYSQTYGELPEEKPSFPGNFSIIPELWIRMNTLAFKELNEATFKQKIVVSYEDLVTNQKGTLIAIFEALKLMQSYATASREIAGKATVLVNTTTEGNPLEKWKDQLSSEEVAVIDGALSKHAEDYAYITTSLEQMKIRPE
ncbi:MAG: sulfotransferase [Bacteroidota bacterium]|nr:sulfotransferase [Bacteroidota bacterium]